MRVDLLQNRFTTLLTELDKTRGVKPLFFGVALYVIELPNQGQHLVSPTGIAVLGIEEFPPGVGPAAYLGALALSEQLVIALEVSPGSNSGGCLQSQDQDI